MRIAALAVIALLASACSVTTQVAVLGERGDILTGTTTATLSSGTFEAGNGRMQCAGNYDPGPGLVLSFVAVCTDGRRGIGQATRDRGGISGQGTIRMDDGETATFIFGPAAATFTPRQRVR